MTVLEDGTSRLELAEEIASAWNRAHLDYAVVHGLGDYPTRIGRDLDVLFPNRADAAHGLRIAVGVAERFGDWPICVARESPFGLLQFLAMRPEAEEIRVLPIDLMFHSRCWRKGPAQITEARTILAYDRSEVGPFVTSAVGLFDKAILSPLLVGEVDRFKRPDRAREWPLTLGADEAAELRRIFGTSLAVEFASDLDAGPEAFRGKWISYRREAIRRWVLRNPVRATVNLVDRMVQQGQAYLHTAAFPVVVTGPGPLRAEAIAAAKRYLETGFFQLHIDDSPQWLEAWPPSLQAPARSAWRRASLIIDPRMQQTELTIVVFAAPQLRSRDGKGLFVRARRTPRQRLEGGPSVGRDLAMTILNAYARRYGCQS